MTQLALRMKTQVLPGKRLEVTAPELPEGREVELIVVLPEGDAAADASGAFESAAEYLASLPPVERGLEEWAAIEREFQTERDAWDR